MPKPDLHKHTLNLRAGDWDYITARFSQHNKSTSDVVRSIVSRFVDALREQDDKEPVNVEIDL